MALTKAQLVDMNANELILDLDADTSLHASTDDQIDIKIGGADDFRFTANTFTALAGSTITGPTIVGSTSVQTPLIEFTDGDDAMTIADGGVVTFAQAPVFPDGSLALVDLDIDGATDIGAAVVDADLFIIDDGASGTNRKVTAARVKTYMGAEGGAFSLANLDIDGATDIGAAIVDADLLIIDDGAGGTNRKVAASRLKTFIGSDTGGFAITNLDIDGGTDIGADLVDADLLIVDDGAGGTNRKVAMSRVKTYIGSSTAADDLTIGDAAVTLSTSSGNITLDATANDTDIIFKGTDATADITMLTLDGSDAGSATFNDKIIVGDGKLVLNSTAVTSTAAELNLLDGVSGLVQADLTKLAAIDSTAAELNILDDATVTTAELNLIDGGTARGTTAVATGDGILINDGGTMRMTNVDTVSTYFAGHNVGGGNIVTTGALDSGSITSGFGAIDNGTSNIRSATITAETAFVPDAANGATLGTASLEFADMYLHDGGIVYFGADQDVELAHVADVGLTLKTATTSDDTKATLTLQTGDTDIAANDVLGQLHFQAPDEGAGTDAILVAAGIAAISEGDFSASNNATKLSFQTGASEAASEKMSLSSAGLLTVADDIVFKDGGTIGVASAVDAMTVSSGGIVTFKDDILIKNGGTIGSASDPDAMSIASGGAVTFTQTPVFPDGSLALADLDIDGGTDIGAAIVDADLLIVDDAAGGTNRKATMSRLATYMGTKISGASNSFQAIGSGSGNLSSALAVPTELYDDGGNYNPSNGKYTCPSDGFYLFVASALKTAGSGTEFYFLQNGNAINGTNMWGYNGDSNQNQLNTYGFLSLSSGDEIQIYSSESVYKYQYLNFGGCKLY